MTRVLSIGTDRGVFAEGSAVRARQRAYAEAFGVLDLIVFSTGKQNVISDGPLTIYPTNSRSRWQYGRDAARIARTLGRPDVVTAQDPFETGYIGWRIARRFRVPLHVQIHTDFLSPEFARHSFLNRIRVHLSRFVLKRASGIRVVSQRIKDSLQAAGYKLRAPVTVLPIFVDIEKFRTAQTPDELARKFYTFRMKLLVVSRLEPEKNVMLALDAFADAALQEACLIIVGEGSQQVALAERAQERAVAHRVLFEGAQDASQYYPLADLVLVSSKYEGYGMVIVEARAAGKPVLATDVGVAREAGAIVVEPPQFSAALKDWFKSGSTAAVEPLSYPYANFSEYVGAYWSDIIACSKTQLRQ